MDINKWLEDIIHGSGGYKDFEDREGLVHQISREHSIASFVIRCLANPACDGSGDVIDSILRQRLGKVMNPTNQEAQASTK